MRAAPALALAAVLTVSLSVPARADSTATPKPKWPSPGANAKSAPAVPIQGSPTQLQGGTKPLVLIDKGSANGKPYLRLPTDVLFDYNKAELDDHANSTIQQAANDLKQAGATGDVKVVGHTDDTGTDKYNLKLSRQRAAAVANAMRSLLGNSGIKLKVSGVGEKKPLVPNNSKANKARNRAVVIQYSSGPDAGQTDDNDISVPMSQPAPTGKGYGQGVQGAMAATQKTINFGTDGNWTVRADVTDLKRDGKLLWVGFYVTPVSAQDDQETFSGDDLEHVMTGSLDTTAAVSTTLYDTKAREDLRGVHDDKGNWVIGYRGDDLVPGQHSYVHMLFPMPSNGDTTGLSLYIPALGTLNDLKVQG